jgi:alpha-glucosidase
MLFLCGHVMAIDSIRITSPDNKTSVVIHINKKITYTLSYNGVVVLQPSEIDMIFNGVKISDDLRIASSKNGFVKDSIISPVPEKRKVIPDVYNQLNIQFKKPYSLIFRVYNDGVAYQFVTKFRDSITVK